MTRFWPGPHLVFEASGRVNRGSRQDGEDRHSHLEPPRRHGPCRSARRPITATSANLSGKKECSSAGDVLDQIGGVWTGDRRGINGGGQGSTILDVTCDPPRISVTALFLRPGSIAYVREFRDILIFASEMSLSPLDAIIGKRVEDHLAGVLFNATIMSRSAV